MAQNIKSLVIRTITDLRKTLFQRTAELAALNRELKRNEAVYKILSGDRRGRRDTSKRTARKRTRTNWNAVLKALPATFTNQAFAKAAGPTTKSAVYLRQTLSRLTKHRKLKRVARAKYRKV